MAKSARRKVKIIKYPALDLSRDNLIGYKIGGHYNGTDMFEEKGELPECPECHYRLDFQAHNPLYRQGRKRRSDLLGTYDGQGIVTKLFHDFCKEQDYANVRLLEFTNDPDHFHLVVDEPVLKLDIERMRIRFLNRCPACGNYEEILGPYPLRIMRSDVLPDGFYRSDLVFGGFSRKHPLIIIGLETGEKMEAGLKGIIFHGVYGR